MNEDRKKRGLANSNLLIAMAITALIIGSSNAMANQTASGSSYKVTEQMQIQTVTGVVVDANGEPIIGASVVEKGTTNGIVTDMDGKFSLNVKVGTTLQITFVGYQPQDVKATKSMKVVLKEDNELLDEVVVVVGRRSVQGRFLLRLPGHLRAEREVVGQQAEAGDRKSVV